MTEYRKENINALILAGYSVGEAVKIVERVIDSGFVPTIQPYIEREDVIDAIADWAVKSPITEANILAAD